MSAQMGLYLNSTTVKTCKTTVLCTRSVRAYPSTPLKYIYLADTFLSSYLQGVNFIIHKVHLQPIGELILQVVL